MPVMIPVKHGSIKSYFLVTFSTFPDNTIFGDKFITKNCMAHYYRENTTFLRLKLLSIQLCFREKILSLRYTFCFYFFTVEKYIHYRFLYTLTISHGLSIYMITFWLDLLLIWKDKTRFVLLSSLIGKLHIVITITIINASQAKTSLYMQGTYFLLSFTFIYILYEGIFTFLEAITNSVDLRLQTTQSHYLCNSNMRKAQYHILLWIFNLLFLVFAWELIFQSWAKKIAFLN